MYGYVLQDWITVRGSTTATFIQNESDWMGFSSFQDIAFWIDIREITKTAGTITLNLQTAPTKDEALFQTMNSVSPIAVATPVTPIPKTILASAPSVPLSTWVRWTLANNTAETWDVSFRILVSANRVVA
jgi:hypothetical protein